MTTFASDKTRRNVMITDLDEADSKAATAETAIDEEKPHRGHNKKRNPAKCLQTISGNFKRRSRSAECEITHENVGTKTEAQGNPKRINYINELLQAKDKQMEQLLQRLATLHKFNDQFAIENKNLHDDVELLNRKVAQLRQQICDCVNCHKLGAELQQVAQTNKTLHNDVGMMKTLVYRLNVQIEYYQDRLRNANNKANNNNDNSASNIQEHNTASRHDTQWQGTVHSHTLAPLLKSYDEMIKDKQELIEQYKQEFDTFTGQLKNVLEENTRLLQHNEALKRDFSTWREERTRLQAQIDVCRTKAEAQTRKTDLTKEKLVEVMHCYEQKLQTLVLDMEHLQAAYTRCKAELASLKSIAQLPQESIVQSLQECKELLEQLKSQHSREKLSLEQTIVELRAKIAAHDQECCTTKEENLQMKKSLQLQAESVDELRKRCDSLQRTTEKVKRSRDRLKARLRIALQWAQKLEEGQANIQNTWDALKRLETIVKHKESQVRGLHARHLEEIEKIQQKLKQKDETIRKILKGKLTTNA